MQKKLDPILHKYEAMEIRLSQPDIMADPAAYTALIKEYNALTPLIEVYRGYLDLLDELQDAQELAHSDDPDLSAMAEEEVKLLWDKKLSTEDELRKMLIPKDPDDDKSVIIEIRAGTGGEEAALFAADLFRMYIMYAQDQGFSVSVTSQNETELGGFREITFLVEGRGAYSRFKFESGVHRVQRVPLTESQGRIQTSAATVAVLPEVEDVTADGIEIKDSDITVESCKSSGAGGQHINKTESAVRLTHKPTGIVIECQQERSQIQNREKALQMLRSKLYHMKKQAQADELAATRRAQVGSGDRSEKIRTYNYPQSRVTDHRIGFSIYDLGGFMNGGISPMIEALTEADTAEKLKQQEGG